MSYIRQLVEQAEAGDATSRAALATIERQYLLGSDEQRAIAAVLRPTPANETDAEFAARVTGRR